MNPKPKILLGIAMAVLLVGIGYFGLFKDRKPVKTINQPPVNAPSKIEEIDTSDWQTYRNETLGFEIKMPKEWTGGYYLGRIVPDDIEVWQEQVGGAEFHASIAQGFPQFNLRVKDSDLTLEEFLGSSWEPYTINGLLAKHRIANQSNLDKVRFGESIIIKNEKRFYYIEFSSGFDSSETIEKTKILWETILKTFKITS